MPDFTEYIVEYTNTKPWNNHNTGSGVLRLSVPNSSGSVRAKLKRMAERKLNSLGVRIDSFKVVA